MKSFMDIVGFDKPVENATNTYKDCDIIKTDHKIKRVEDPYEELYKRAVKVYGFEHQKNKLFEEMGELLCELARMQDNRTDWDKITEEMADLHIVLSQLICALDDDKRAMFENHRMFKLRRLEHRIEKKEMEEGIADPEHSIFDKIWGSILWPEN